MARRRSLGRVLRSRRVAVWFLVGVPVWGFLGTLVPSAFSSPLFIAAMLYLAVSTFMCAWERTGHALEVFGRAGHITRSQADRVRRNPTLSVPVRPDLGSAELRRKVAATLRFARLRVTEGESVVEGRSGRWGLFGSPVFHWSLALLIVVVVAGRLSRSEGFIGVPVGGSVLDVAESYQSLDEAPLFPGHPGYEIAVPEMERDLVDGDVHRGAAPVVVIRENGSQITSQRVYSNNPLRFGWTMIHASEYGLSPYMSLETSDGVTVVAARPLLDLVEDVGRSAPAVFDFVDESGTALLTVEVSAPLDAEEPSLDVAVTDATSGERVVGARLAVGEALDLPDGERLRFVDTGDFALLSVVHDWSVPFIYVLLAVGLTGLSVAVLDPYRRVLVMVVDGESGLAINALLLRGRASALFLDRVEEALQSAGTGSMSLSEEER